MEGLYYCCGTARPRDDAVVMFYDLLPKVGNINSLHVAIVHVCDEACIMSSEAG